MSIEQAAAEVRELIPRVLQALHANNVWESVKSAEEITSSQFEDQPRPYILILTRANTAGSERWTVRDPPSVVVKFETKVPHPNGADGEKFWEIDRQTVEIHQMLSDQGVSTTLLATSLEPDSSIPNFTVETSGVCYFDMAASAADPNFWDSVNGATGGGGDWARLLARMHNKVPVQWFDKYRRELVELCPVMQDAAADSPLWGMIARPDKLVQVRLAAAKAGVEGNSAANQKKFLHQKAEHSPTNEDVKRIAALLPKPRGEHASRVVTCHGDLWAANVVKQSNGQAVLIDLEGVCVSYAATEFAQFINEDRGHAEFRGDFSRIYLETLLELEEGSGSPGVTDEDVDKFWFEALVAGEVITGILRPLCWGIEGGYEEDSTADIIARAERFSAYVEKLRCDWDLTLQILRKAAAASDMGSWSSNENMDSVLGIIPGAMDKV